MKWLSIRNPLNKNEVKLIEVELEVSFPKDYTEQIGPINGGALTDAYIEHLDLGQIAYSRNIPLDKEASANIFEMYELFRPEFKHIVPFAFVGNGDLYCFDLSNKCVALWIHEQEKFEKICDSFSELLRMIRVED